jgi:hypothetical protein
MAFESDFLELMPDNVIFRAGTAVDNYGKRTYGTALTVLGRLIYDDVVTRTEDQRQFSVTGKFLTYGPQTSLSLRHRMTLPDNSEAIIYGIDQLKDNVGDYYTAVKFGQ